MAKNGPVGCGRGAKTLLVVVSAPASDIRLFANSLSGPRAKPLRPSFPAVRVILILGDDVSEQGPDICPRRACAADNEWTSDTGSKSRGPLLPCKKSNKHLVFQS